MDPGRRAHYGDFYGAQHTGPVAVVWGNCQAESLRVLLSGSPTFPWPTVRVPPVFELEPGDLEPIRALLPHISLLISQPIRDGYRDLPIGTDEMVASLPDEATLVRWPVFRYIGLHPFAAIVRHPTQPSLDPPVVPYHDLRTLVLAAGHPPPAEPSADALRSVAEASVAELARRERLGTDVQVSDLLVPLGADVAHTLNHPKNPVLLALAGRILSLLGHRSEVADPGRALLGGISAPLEPAVLDALGLDASPRDHWIVEGREVSVEEVRDAQLAWYGENPEVVDAGLRGLADQLALLGI